MNEPKMLYVGPLQDFSGYAEASRNYLDALDAAGANLVARSLNYDGANFKSSKRQQELLDLDTANVNIILQHTTPNETQRKEGCFNVSIFCWETDRIPSEWVVQLNMMDLVIVSCRDNLEACRKSGVIVPIEIVHFAFDPKKYEKDIAPFALDGGENKFKILSICQMSKKKGIDALLRAYFSEFDKEDNTLLILKVYTSTSEPEDAALATAAHVEKIKSLMRLNNYPDIWLIHTVMSPEDIERLYATADCYALTSRGEGWSITHFDAMGYGLPPIATNWGGPTEFITENEGWLVDCHMSPCFDMPHPHSFMYTSKDNWPEPHICDIKHAMREAFEQWKINKIKPENSCWSQRIENCKAKAKEFSLDIVGPELKRTVDKHYKRWLKNV